MQNKSLELQFTKKKNYVTPRLEVSFLQMEEGIAAGSAIVKPVNETSEMLEEWQVEPDRNKDLSW